MRLVLRLDFRWFCCGFVGKVSTLNHTNPRKTNSLEIRSRNSTGTGINATPDDGRRRGWSLMHTAFRHPTQSYSYIDASSARGILSGWTMIDHVICE